MEVRSFLHNQLPKRKNSRTERPDSQDWDFFVRQFVDT
jgi:hypothetical protein